MLKKNKNDKKEEKKSLIEDMDYQILPEKGREYYSINVKRKNDKEYMLITTFFEKNDIPLPKEHLFCTCRSIEEGEKILKYACETILKWERGELKNRETVEGDLKDLFIIENL